MPQALAKKNVTCVLIRQMKIRSGWSGMDRPNSSWLFLETVVPPWPRRGGLWFSASTFNTEGRYVGAGKVYGG